MLEIFKALSDPIRVRLVAVLLRGEFTVQELTSIMQTGQSKISWHLKILTEAGILTVKRQGTWSYYRADSDAPLFTALRPILEQYIPTLPDREKDLSAVAAVLDERRRRSQEFFDSHARQWDELAQTLLPLPAYHEHLLSTIPAGGTIVEIGIGTGGLLPALAAKADAIIGVDHSPAMLDEACRRLALAGIGGIDLRLGEMSHLPVPDSSCDSAILNMVLHHAADPQSVLTEVCRIVRPNGRVIIADLARHEKEVARERLADQWLGFDGDELTGWLINAGFTDIKCMIVRGDERQEAVLIVTGFLP